MQSKIYHNCHAHCFTIDQVPDNFAKRLIFFYRLIPIRWIKKHKAIKWVIKKLNDKYVLIFLKIFAKNIDKSLNRLLSFIRFFDVAKNQQTMVDLLMGYYPSQTQLVLLTMDMEYMGAGKSIHNFYKQVEELAAVKSNPAYVSSFILLCSPIRAGQTFRILLKMQ